MQNTRRGIGNRYAQRRADFHQDLRDCDLSAVAVALSAPGSVAEVRGRIVEIAALANEGCDAGLFLVEDERVVTVACTAPYIFSLDRVQFDADDGPCLDAISERRMYFAGDLMVDDQWPRFRVSAVAAGVRSVFSVPLAVQGLSALALYSKRRDAFDDAARTKASLYATLAAIALDMAAANTDAG